jgi:AsmA protein
MNYLAKATLVATSTGQGGKDAAQVAGVTVPVKVTGPFDALSFSVDVGALATDVAKDALQRELDRRLGGGKAGQQGGSVEDALRGLFGRKK